jgi:hypothetical protein
MQAAKSVSHLQESRDDQQYSNASSIIALKERGNQHHECQQHCHRRHNRMLPGPLEIKIAGHSFRFWSVSFLLLLLGVGMLSEVHQMRNPEQ